MPPLNMSTSADLRGHATRPRTEIIHGKSLQPQVRLGTLRSVPAGTRRNSNGASDNGNESKEPLTLCVLSLHRVTAAFFVHNLQPICEVLSPNRFRTHPTWEISDKDKAWFLFTNVVKE